VITITLKRFIGFDDKGEQATEIWDEKTYYAPQPSTRIIKRAYEVLAEINKAIEDKNINQILTDTSSAYEALSVYVVEVFRNQFTVEDVLDGTDGMETLDGIVRQVTGTTNEKIEEIPNVETAVGS